MKHKKITKKINRWLKRAIPGLITGGADNDPSGIATYSISGATFGFSQLWVMLLATPMLIAVQSMCAKLGDVQRKGLSVILREEFSPVISWLATAVLIVSNIFTIGADILAMSAALELVTHIGLAYWVLPVTILVWYIVLFQDYKKIRKFLLIMLLFFLAYIVAAVLAHPDWQAVLRNLFVPSFKGVDKSYYVAVVGILGTTITPYLFFWQVKEELEEYHTKKQALSDADREDIVLAPGFIFSQIITMFIIIATAATLFHSGISIQTASDAARALEPVAGNFAGLLFAAGIIGAGLLALPVLSASTAYVVSETAGWKHDSLNSKIRSAKGFYAVITLSLLAGVAIMVSGLSPIRALYYSQVLAGLLAPFLLILILILANRKRVMGDYRNGWFDNTFGTLAILVMLAAGALMFFG
jgi:NRAMP (natural resistance-associated macrophage protein)-like metal ion transporter